MEIQQIPQADILDILFDGRNKDYGAYQLRKTYNTRLAKSMGWMGATCLLLIGGYTLAGRLDKNHVKAPPIVIDDTLMDVGKKEIVLPPPAVPKPQPPVQMATIQSTIPRIVPNDQVKPNEVPPTQEEQENVKIGDKTQQGNPDEGIDMAPTSKGNGTGVTEGPQRQGEAEDDNIYIKVEKESEYPGGSAAWIRFLQKNWRTPDEAINTNTGGTVVVQFVVDKEGNVSDVQAIDGPQLLWAEAVRVIRKSGRWAPANQNGHHVNSYKKQPIVVQIQNE